MSAVSFPIRSEQLFLSSWPCSLAITKERDNKPGQTSPVHDPICSILRFFIFSLFSSSTAS